MTRKLNCIYPRGSNWVVDTTYKGRRIWATCATKQIAEATLREKKSEIDRMEHLGLKPKPRITLRDFFPSYIEWCRNHNKPRFAKVKEQYLRTFYEYFGAETLLSDITREKVERFKNWRKEHGRQKASLRHATVNRELACLKHIYSKAIEWGKVTENPVKGIARFKEENHGLRYLEEEELRRLIECAPPHLKPIIIVGAHTGLRKSEILNLKWNQIDFRTGNIEVLDQKNRDKSYVPMNRVVIEILRKQPRRIGGEYVFVGSVGCGEDGKAFREIYRSFKQSCKHAGIINFRFHDLRHTYASHLAMQGVPILTIKELLRHKDITMTMRYAHLSPDHKKQAVEKLGEALTQRENMQLSHQQLA